MSLKSPCSEALVRKNVLSVSGAATATGLGSPGCASSVLVCAPARGGSNAIANATPAITAVMTAAGANPCLPTAILFNCINSSSKVFQRTPWRLSELFPGVFYSHRRHAEVSARQIFWLVRLKTLIVEIFRHLAAVFEP